jgi:hypothetical protein
MQLTVHPQRQSPSNPYLQRVRPARHVFDPSLQNLLIFRRQGDERDAVSHRRIVIRRAAFGFEGLTFFDDTDINVCPLWKYDGKIDKTAAHRNLRYASLVARSRGIVCQFTPRKEIVPRMNATVFATSRFAPVRFFLESPLSCSAICTSSSLLKNAVPLQLYLRELV